MQRKVDTVSKKSKIDVQKYRNIIKINVGW